MSIDPEHEKAYSPSSWCKRLSGPEVLVNFLQAGKKGVDKVRSTVSCDLDVPYAAGERTKYDIYGNDLPNDAPVFVFIHGGYWQECSKDLIGFHVDKLVKNGIKVYNVGYDLCPAVTLTDIVSEIKIATDKILKQAQVMGSRCVWIAGHSAGAHLAACLLHDKEWLDSARSDGRLKLVEGLILIGGIYDLEPLLRTSYNDALKLSRTEIEKFSLAKAVTSGYKPLKDTKVILTVGECDAPQFVRESRVYAQKLIEFVDNVEFLLLRNDIDHFDIVENLQNTNFVLTKIILNVFATPTVSM